MRPGKRWVRVGVVLGIVGGFGSLVAWSSRERMPARLVLKAPEKSRPEGFTPDGRSFLTLSPEGMVFWDVAGGRPRRPWSLLSFPVSDFSKDGKTCLGVHGYSFDDATIGLVDVASGSFRARFSSRFPNVLRLSFGDEGRSIRAFLGDRDSSLREVVTWDIASGLETRRPVSGPKGPGFFGQRPGGISPDGRTLAYLDESQNGVQLWDVEADQAIGGLLRTPTTRLIPWAGAAFTPDNQRLVVSRSDGCVESWNLADRRLIRIIEVHPDGFTSNNLQISPDGRTLASTGQFFGTPTGVDRVLFAVRKLIEGGNRRAFDDEVVVVNLDTGRRLARWPGSVHPTFSPDGRTIVTQEWDGTFSIRDAPQPTASGQ